MGDDFLLHNFKIAQKFSADIVAGANLDELIAKCDGGHVMRTLIFLRNHKEAQALIKRFTLPVANAYIEAIVRGSINLPKGVKLTNAHLQRAVLSALFYPLRQFVGSCFATAPAIHIQNEQKENLLIDLHDLLMLCQLKRTFAGREYVIPISPTCGRRGGDHPLLRVWEYTLASFSDYKEEFCQWNLYKNLGLHPKEKGGVGELLYTALQTKLDMANQETAQCHHNYLRAVDEARACQALLRQSDTYRKAHMRKAELEARSYHARACRDLYDDAQSYADGLSNMFSFLIKQYTEQLQKYFCEIFDPDSVRENSNLYEDSPAGFRLIYKHGRDNPLAWSPLYSLEEYTCALKQFFVAVEPLLISTCGWEGGEKILQEVTTLILHYLQSEKFRSFATKASPPWSYISGGNMHKLLQCYYCIEGEIAEEKKRVKNPLDLLIFLLDLMKALPYCVTKRFEEDDSYSLLMYSPVHAFLFKPGLHPFIEGWLDKGFTYTWVRDNVILPGQLAYKELPLGREDQMKIGTALLGKDFSPQEEILTPPSFHTLLTKNSTHSREEIDTLLFNALPRPNPLIFADTNWLNYFFAFAVNPATLELDLYRYDPLTKRGIPMTMWEGEWNDIWGVLTNPGDIGGNYTSQLSIKINKV